MINSLFRNRSETPGTIVFLLILLLGLFLRFYDIRGESLWLDEGTYIVKAQRSIPAIISDLRLRIHHSPLYLILLHYWIQVFGNSAVITRSLSAISGFIAIIYMYKLGSLLFNKNTGLLASLLLAVSVLHISFSQEVKGYSLLILLTLLSMYVFIHLLQQISLKIFAGYITATILLLYTHYYGFFIVLIQNFYFVTLFLFRKNAQKLNLVRWITLQSILFVLYVPWVWLLTSYSFTVDKIGISDTISIPISIRPKNLWFTHIRGRTISDLPIPSFDSIIETFAEYAGSYPLLWLYLLLALFSFFILEKTKGIKYRKNLFTAIENCTWNVKLSSFSRNYLLFLWIIIPVFLPFIISFLYKPIYATRYTIAASLPFYILTARGILNLKSRHMKTLLIMTIVTLSLWNIHTYYTKIDKQQWREVAGYIDENAGHRAPVIFLPGYTKKIIFDYYSKRADLEKIPLPFSPPIERENLELFIDDYQMFWLVVSFKKDTERHIKDTLQSLTYKIKGFKRFDGDLSLPEWKIIDVFLFEKSID